MTKVLVVDDGHPEIIEQIRQLYPEAETVNPNTTPGEAFEVAPTMDPQQFEQAVKYLRTTKPPKRTYTAQDARAKQKRVEKRRQANKNASRARRSQRSR